MIEPALGRRLAEPIINIITRLKTILRYLCGSISMQIAKQFVYII